MTARFEILLERFQSGEATPEELVELDTLLRAQPDKRRILVERLLLEVHLYKAFAGIAPVKQAPVAPVRLGWFVPVGAAAAVPDIEKLPLMVVTLAMVLAPLPLKLRLP